MTHKITKNSYKTLIQLAECRVLTSIQLSVLNQRSCQVVRRDIRLLEKEGFIDTGKQRHGQGRGRPADIIFLAPAGVKFLQDEGVLSNNATFIEKKVTDGILVDHHLLVNWFHLHLIHMERVIPQLSVNFLSANANTLVQNNRFSLKERVKMDSSLEGFTEFIPDGAFSLTYKDTETSKTLLFFLEVDMGTETLASENRNSKDIRQKFLNYQALFRGEQYKRYEKIFSGQLNGFRLLFLANIYARMAAICRLIREMPPSEFIWVTDQQRMFSHGLSAEIWTRGGKNDGPPRSVMGSKPACESPVIETIR
jgi:hypothetical protein